MRLTFFLILILNVLTATSHAFDPLAMKRAVCVDVAINNMGINTHMTIDPELLKDVVANEMYLGEFSEVMNAFEEEFLSKDISLKNTILTIRNALITKHPAMADAICEANKMGLTKLKNQVVLNRVIHHIYALDKVSTMMINDISFMNRLYEYIEKQKKDYLNGRELKDAIGSIDAEKVKLLGNTFNQYINYRKDGIKPDDIKDKNWGLYKNIKWAAGMDLARGYYHNGWVGEQYLTTGVINVPIISAIKAFWWDAGLVEKLYLCGPQKLVCQKFPELWTELYQSWNMAFILGYIEDLHLFIPKLTTPLVINATPEEYLFKRGITLWLSINIGTITKVHKGKNRKELIKRTPLLEEFVTKYGRINHEYAKEYLKVYRENH